MKKGKNSISFLLACSVFLVNCSSTTMIQSDPPRAKLYLDGKLVGQTPYLHRDSRIVGSSMEVKIEKDGYRPLITTIRKNEEANVGAIVAGLFTVVPFLWLLKYKPVHIFELQSLTVLGTTSASELQPIQSQLRSKFKKLRKLNKQFQDHKITKDDFLKQKARILDEKE
jgi:hypothetical protein